MKTFHLVERFGDFCQVLPVIPHGYCTGIVENCLKRSLLWCHFKIVKLTQNMHANRDQQEFAEWVLQVGNSKLTCISDTNEDSREIPTNCAVADSIIDSAFDDLTSDITKRIILAPKNDASLLFTKQALDRLPAEQCIYLSLDQAICDKKEEQQNYPLEFINSLTLSGMPEHWLCLKVGSIIVLLRNLDIQSDVCNRTRLTVKLLYENIIVAETISVNKKQY